MNIRSDIAQGDGSDRGQLAALARFELRNRERRTRLIRYDVFADPAWDMLLDLYVRHGENEPAHVSALCGTAGVALTTALRWIGLLMELELIVQTPVGGESREPHVTLTQRGIDEMERYLRDILERERIGSDVAARPPRG